MCAGNHHDLAIVLYDRAVLLCEADDLVRLDGQPVLELGRFGAAQHDWQCREQEAHSDHTQFSEYVHLSTP